MFNDCFYVSRLFKVLKLKIDVWFLCVFRKKYPANCVCRDNDLLYIEVVPTYASGFFLIF